MKAIFAVVLAALCVAAYGAEISCPPVNGVDVTILPNPEDCKTFYICNEGIPYLMNCPPGQEFNAELRVCDLPEQANCVASGHKPTHPPRPSTTTPPPAKPSTTPTPPPPGLINTTTPAVEGTTPTPAQNCLG
nr:PREDICTED: peritrophin-1-like [Megachile rotundata]